MPNLWVTIDKYNKENKQKEVIDKNANIDFFEWFY